MKNINLKERIKNSKKVTKAALALALVGATGISMFAGVKLFAATNQDKKEKVVYTFTSKSKPEEILGKLKAGKKYKLREKKAPDGYVRSEDKEFTVNTDGKLQEIKVENDYTKVEISKKDVSGEKELPGANMKIVEMNGDEEGKTVQEWTTTDTPKTFNKMKVGKYKLIEVQAPDGYTIANSVVFEVKEEATIQKVEMKDDTTKIKIYKVDKDTPDTQLEGAEFEIIEVENEKE